MGSGLSVPQIGLGFRAPAPRAALKDVRMMQEAIEQRGDGGVVTEQLPPVVDWSVRGKDGRGAFVAAHHQLEEILGGGMRQLAHAEVINDEERDRGQVVQICLPGAVQRGIRNFLDQGVCFSVHDAIALLDGGPSDGLSEMAFARARRAEKECVFALRHETGGGEFVNEGPIHLPVEFKIKAGQGTVRIAESGEFDASLKQAVLSALQFRGIEKRVHYGS